MASLKSVRRFYAHSCIILTEKQTQAKCPSPGEWVTRMWHILYDEIVFGSKNERIDVYYNMDEPWKRYAE